MKVSIQVTLSHIRRGKPGICCQCALALAINPHVKRNAQTEVLPGSDVGHVYLKGIPYPLPAEANRFARAFDRGRRDLKPFTFTLDIPREMVRVRA